jgi:hypothetical protein
MLHSRFVLLVPLALGVALGLGLAGDGVQAVEPVAKARPAVLVESDGFEVTPVARRRRGDDESDGSWSLLTMRGTFDCPGGYTTVYRGNIYAFVQKGVDVPQFGDVEPYCWPLEAQQPAETTFLGNWQKVALCALCARQPGTAISGAPSAGTTPIPGGGDTGMPDRNTIPPDDDPDQPSTGTHPVPGA